MNWNRKQRLTAVVTIAAAAGGAAAIAGTSASAKPAHAAVTPASHGAAGPAGSTASTPPAGGMRAGPPSRRGGGPPQMLDVIPAAADYLGVAQPQLTRELRTATLATIAARTSGRSVSGLIDALLAAARSETVAAEKAGRLSAAQERRALAVLTSQVTAIVDGRGGEVGGRPPTSPGALARG